MDFKSISSSLTKQSHAKTGLQEPQENNAKEVKNTRASDKRTDKVSLSSRGVEQSAKALRLVEQLQKSIQSDPGAAALSLATLDLDKATELLR